MSIINGYFFSNYTMLKFQLPMPAVLGGRILTFELDRRLKQSTLLRHLATLGKMSLQFLVMFTIIYS